MNDRLQRTAHQFEQATAPEAVFGEIHGTVDEKLAGLKRIYHQLAKIVHPDSYHTREEQSLAQTAFTRLSEWCSTAEIKIRAGVYGLDRPGATLLQTKKRAYSLDGSCKDDGLYHRYPCRFEEDGRSVRALIKMVRDERDNDLAQNEARVIRALLNGKEARKFAPYIPRWVDSFVYGEHGEDRQANVFEQPEGWYSLAEVRQAYPVGVDSKDMAWMWRRLLVVLGFAHLNSIIHGTVLPRNVLIQPEQHGLLLVEWSFAVTDPQTSGAHITALDLAYEPWYPNEVRHKDIPGPETDIYMAAQCMIDLLGGDPLHQSLPAAVPNPIRMFLKACTLPAKKARPHDAWGLKEEFDELLRRLWGERKFHPFTMLKSTTTIGG